MLVETLMIVYLQESLRDVFQTVVDTSIEITVRSVILLDQTLDDLWDLIMSHELGSDQPQAV